MKTTVLVVCLIFLSQVAQANLIVVDSNKDAVTSDGSCTLREALIAANFDIFIADCNARGLGDDLIWVLLGTNGDTIQLNNTLPIIDGVEIQGPGADKLELIPDSNHAGHVFQINTNRDVSLNGFLIGDAQSSAVDVVEVADLTVDGMRFVNNQAATNENGGAINADTITGNTKSINSLIISNSEFEGNQATLGGAVAASGRYTFDVSNSFFKQNMANSQGSAIHRTFDNSSVPIASVITQIDQSVFTENNGSALYFFYQTININESVFSDNTGNFTINANNVRGQINNSLFAGRESGTAVIVAGLGNYSGSLLFINFNTFINDQGSFGNYGLDLGVDGNAEVVIRGNAFAGSNGVSCSEDNSGVLLSDGYNLEAEGNTCNLLAISNDLPSTDAMLLALDYYGGDRLIAPPSPISPLVDAGVGCDSFDLSGEGRPRDGDASGQAGECDIGAIERPSAFGLTLNYTGDGSGFATIDSLDLFCDDFFFTSCFWPLPRNETFTIQPFANSGSTFAGWSGHCTGTSSCEVTMDSFMTVEAEFAALSSPVTLTLNKVMSMPGLSATVTSTPAGINCGTQCSADYMDGEVVTLTAALGAGTVIDQWDNCDLITNNGNSCISTLTADTTITLFVVQDPDIIFNNGFE